MIHYSIQIIVFQLLFIVIYDVFLKRETFFNCNRAYLIITSVLSLVLPFIKLESFQNIIPQEYIIRLPEVVINNNVLDANNGVNVNEFAFSMQHVLYLGMLFAFVMFILKMVKLIHLISKSPKSKTEYGTIITLLNSDAAFSFFRYVFIGDQLNVDERQSILAHETIHVKEKHSLDLLFFEAQRIVFWFNPLLYIYQNRIATLHEYIADDKVVITQNKKHYYERLLAQAFSVKNISFINPFFKKSLIKKRIIMLSKSKSKQQSLVKYLLLIPAIVGMLFYTACVQESDDVNQDESLKYEQKKSLNSEKKVETNEVAFSIIENVPVFPGCEDAEDQKKCFSKNINKLVGQNFNTKLADDIGLTGVLKISVFFKISEDGTIKELKARAPHPDLEEEAIRVVGLLPKLIPGTHGGKAVTVPYYLPIKFKIKE